METPDNNGPRRIAVFDIGKTNARMILADLDAGRELATRRMENRVLPGPPYPHLDTARQAAFLLDSLGSFHRDEGGFDGIFVTAHGATVALLGDAGLAMPVLDYEYAGPDETAPEYDLIRPPFSLTGTPRMPGGLNIGAQLYWLRARFPDAFATVRHALFWPQYWTWLLTGRMFSEISYASGHGDVWSLPGRAPVATPGMAAVIGGLFPPLAPAFSPAGPLLPQLARRLGLPEGIQVLVGAHDSSLALVPHDGENGPCVVMSTGTWLTAFAIGTETIPETQAPGVMASLDIFGRIVPNYRFMAGKARADLLARMPADAPRRPIGDCRIVQDPASGLFRLVDAERGRPAIPDGPELAGDIDRILARDAAAGMRGIGARGPVRMTGPFADNPGFRQELQRNWPWPVERQGYEESLVEQVAMLSERAQGRTQ
ncbi:FGGY family carbohydrate kinase [Paracoccus sp. (in: a-proteobacteria)]|uniref:FGGY family carbohydrate kinase n=1 Tax=Paracoccus sp. TaxID=267 RepID=UPI003A840974